MCLDDMVRPDNSSGETVEVLTGRFDVKIGVRGLMVREARKELGLDINEEAIDLLNIGEPLALSPCILTEKIFLSYVEVSSSQFIEGETFDIKPREVTKLLRVSIDRLEEVICGDMKTWALVQWFLVHKLGK